MIAEVIRILMTFGEHDDQQSTRRTDTGNTRRRFVAGSAGALGGLALGGSLVTGAAVAHEDDDDDDEDHSDGESGNGDSDGNTPPAFPSEGMFEDDVDVLNYALTLEYLEAEFYNRALDNLGEGDLGKAEQLKSVGGEVAGRVLSDLEVVRTHENIHASVLFETIEDLGGEPVGRPEFDFGGATEDPTAFLATARALENTGVSAYNGAIGAVENPDLKTASASIATVEGRHASFLNRLNGQIGFPRAFDRARSRSEVLEIASQFIV